MDDHLGKIIRKGYMNQEAGEFYVKKTVDGHRAISLPRLIISGVTLDNTVLNISVGVGRFAQWIGKFSGASGEETVHSTDQIIRGCGLNLLYIAQCCFTMLYILEDTFLMDIHQLVKAHIQKLKVRGYVK
jgi:hypothetical protein